VAGRHVIFLRDNALVAQTLDLDSLTLTGAASPIAERVELIGPASAAFAVSETGMLAYLAAGDGSRLVWVNREGREVGRAVADAGGYGDLEMAPDGERAIVSVTDPSLNTRDLWIVDLARGVRTRLTFDRAEDVAPVWSPDGTRLLFASNRRGHFDLFQKPASGVVPEQLVLGDGGEKYPMSWAADGESALYWEYDGDGTRLATLPLTGEQERQVFLEGRVSQGRLSPDGRWVVYDSAESGRSEVYVVSYPAPTRRWQVSVAGGSLSRWRADGREIFYVARDNKLMAAAVDGLGAELTIANAQALFDARPVGPRAFYAPAPDGQRFLINMVAGDSAPAITLLQNWSQALTP
jgi:Tol biopolymer transport system component